MSNRAPLKYRIISQKRTQDLCQTNGQQHFILCLSIGLHASVRLNELIEFKLLGELPRNMADSVLFSPCDCDEHPTAAPSWLAELTQAYLGNQRKAVSPRRKNTKPKKRPTMGR